MKELFAVDEERNLIGEKLKELSKVGPQDLPNEYRLSIIESGTIIGEDDAVKENEIHQHECVCIS